MPIPFGRENTRRTLEAPRWRDAYSFSGRGRMLYQKYNEHPITHQPDPPTPPMPGAPPLVRG
jgi:hypothetical protein